MGLDMEGPPISTALAIEGIVPTKEMLAWVDDPEWEKIADKLNRKYYIIHLIRMQPFYGKERNEWAESPRSRCLS